MENETCNAIKKMAKAGKKISFYSVMKETKKSKAYLYRNKKIRLLIDSYRKPVMESATADTEKTLVTITKLECARLKRQIQKQKEENSETWKQKYLREHEKYLAVLEENKELRKQLMFLYSVNANQETSVQ